MVGEGCCVTKTINPGSPRGHSNWQLESTELSGAGHHAGCLWVSSTLLKATLGGLAAVYCRFPIMICLKFRYDCHPQPLLRTHSVCPVPNVEVTRAGPWDTRLPLLALVQIGSEAGRAHGCFHGWMTSCHICREIKSLGTE